VMFVRTFMNYSKIELGFVPEHVLSITIDPLGAHYSEDQLLPTYHRIQERLQGIPSVRSSAFAYCGLARGCRSISGIKIEGRNEQQDMQENQVSPDYFSTVGMRLIAGRFFTKHDIARSRCWQ